MPTPPEPPDARRPRTLTGRPLDVVAKVARAREPVLAATASVQIGGVTLDSRAVRPGDLYAALPGSRVHGAAFAGDVAGRGAVAVLTDRAGATLIAGQPAAARLAVLEVDDPRAVLGEVAAAVYGHPAERLVTLGVTGTNGKTTTTYLLDGALRAAGHLTGLLGTVETRVGADHWRSTRTTPEAPDVQALLARMVEEGASACSMEVSSHALSLHRVDGVVFDVAGFTNLSQDHLDFHDSMEEYFEAKAALFTPERSRHGVVCVDGSWGARMVAQATVPVETLWTLPSPPPADLPAVDWRVEDAVPDGAGSRFTLVHREGRRIGLRSPLPGGFNVSNAALAYVMLEHVADRLAATPHDLAAAVGEAGQVPGRMQAVAPAGAPAPGEPTVLVDYAHTPGAVEAVLRALVTSRRPLVVVLGAGGDRDPRKRHAMGTAAGAIADVVIVTDDNPRSEPPELIRAAVLAGARTAAAERAGGVGGGDGGAPAVLEYDRRRTAVAEAVRRAWGHDGDPGGTVLVAGKGHEQGQEVAGVVHPFDDRSVAREVLLAARQTGPGDPGRPAHRSRPSDEETST